MGASFVNYQIWSEDTQSVIRAVEKVTRNGFYVSIPKNKWITVYDEMPDLDMDGYEIQHDSVISD